MVIPYHALSQSVTMARYVEFVLPPTDWAKVASAATVKRLYLPVFAHGEQWLQCYLVPHTDVLGGRSLGLFLTLSSRSTFSEAIVDYKLRIADKEDNQLFVGTSGQEKHRAGGHGWGWSVTLNAATLAQLGPSAGLVVQVTVYSLQLVPGAHTKQRKSSSAGVGSIGGSASSGGGSLGSNRSNSSGSVDGALSDCSDDGGHSITIPSAAGALSVASLFNDPTFSDCTVRVQRPDDTSASATFHCSRMVLAAASPVFRAMLANGMSEAQASEIIMRDVQPLAAEHLLRYMHGQRVALPLEALMECYRLADQYDVRSLVDALDSQMAAMAASPEVLAVLVPRARLLGLEALHGQLVEEAAMLLPQLLQCGGPAAATWAVEDVRAALAALVASGETASLVEAIGCIAGWMQMAPLAPPVITMAAPKECGTAAAGEGTAGASAVPCSRAEVEDRKQHWPMLLELCRFAGLSAEQAFHVQCWVGEAMPLLALKLLESWPGMEKVFGSPAWAAATAAPVAPSSP